MAGDWIKMRNDLAEDPAVIGMAAQLQIDEFAVIGRLHVLWAWADRQSRDGHACGVTTSWIDRKVQRDGFADAMVTVGWLEVTEDGISIPNFANHNGESAKTRALSTNRKQKQRAVTQMSTEVSRSERDKSGTREEKRREEKKETKTGAVRFPEFWNAWPKSERKQDRGVCEGKWAAKNLDEVADLILADVATKKQTQKWQAGYIEAPEVYINRERWKDGVTPDEPADEKTSLDPDSRSAIEAEGIAKGIGPWNEVAEQWHVYKSRVRGKQPNGLSLGALSALAAQHQGAH